MSSFILRVGEDRHTQVVLAAMFEFLMSHELLHSTSHGLHVVDDEFIKVGVGVGRVHN